MPKNEDGLTDKQRAFAREYLKDNNGTQAAIRAGYSAATAESQASRLLRNVKIRAFIDKHEQETTQKVLSKLEISEERILQEYARIGFSDLRKVLAPGGHLLNPQDWDDDTAAAIAGVEVVTRRVGYGEDAEVEYVHKIKPWDKPKALDSMARHLGMFEGKPPADPGDDQPGLMDDRAAARRVAHMLLRAANTPVMLPE